MNSLAFFDTNILVYTDDWQSPEKQEKAISLLEAHRLEGSAVISLQVLQEYYYAITRKLQIAPEHAQEKVRRLSRGHVIRFDTHDIISAIELHRLNRISFWDAMILHAARISKAGVLYSEDLQHNSTVAGVRIVNPFL